jgi:hypothetical protein
MSNAFFLPLRDMPWLKHIELGKIKMTDEGEIKVVVLGAGGVRGIRSDQL